MVMFALEGVESRRQEDAPSLKSFRLGQASKGHKVLTTVKGYSYKMEQQQSIYFVNQLTSYTVIRGWI